MFSSALLLLCFEPSRAQYVLFLPGRTDADPFSPHSDAKASCRRRAYSANQISDRQPLSKEPTASDPGSALLRNPLRKTQLQDLQQLSPELQPVHYQVGAPSDAPCAVGWALGTGSAWVVDEKEPGSRQPWWVCCSVPQACGKHRWDADGILLPASVC